MELISCRLFFVFYYISFFVTVHDPELIDDQVPVPAPLCPSAVQILNSQIQHLPQAVIIREYILCLCHFSELSIQSFNRICRIDDLSDLYGIIEIRA